MIPVHQIASMASRKRWGSELVKHVSVSRNYGMRGGWIRLENWLTVDGVPTGMTSSRIEYPGESPR